MFDGYMDIDGVEIFNNERAATYGAALSSLEFKCSDEYAGLWRGLDHLAPYTSPSADDAPWYRSGDSASTEFRGVYCLKAEGEADSSRVVEVQELTGDGAVTSLPRWGSKEIRFRVMLLATTDRGIEFGTSWLRNTLEGGGCGKGGDCLGRTLGTFNYNPAAPTNTEAQAKAIDSARFYPDIDLLDGVRVISTQQARTGVLREVEFIIVAARPWRYTAPVSAGTFGTVQGNTAAEVACATQADAYDILVRDPISPINKPPRPPAIDVMPMPASWTRYQKEVPSSWGDRPGRVVPVFYIFNLTDTARRMIRIRIYKAGFGSTCAFEGEWLVTYIPAGASITIDGVREKITVIEANGKETSAGHLVVGTSGRPRRWAALNCGGGYSIVVDADGALGGVGVETYLSIRE